MSNPFTELRDQLSIPEERFDIALVTDVSADKLTIETEDGIVKTVWGTAAPGDYVIVQGKTVLGRVNDENTITAYVP